MRVWGGSENGGGNSGAGFRSPSPQHYSPTRDCPIVPASLRPEDPLGLSTPDPVTPVRLEPPHRSPATATSPTRARSHSPSMVPARLRCCAPGSAPAACSARCWGRRGRRAPTAGLQGMPQRPLLAPPRAGRPRAPPRRRRCGAVPPGRRARKGLRGES